MISGEEDKMNVRYYWGSLQAYVFCELKNSNTYNWLGMSSGLHAYFRRTEFSTSCENVLLSTMCFLKVSKFSNHAFILF
jgi:hypothetical protein